MKTMKKVSTTLAAFCLMFFCFTFASHAAEGTLQFSDPETTNGSEVTVDVKISTAGGAIGDGNVNLTYDPAMLEFVSGTNASGGDGAIALLASGDGTAAELNYSIVFKALAKGTTTIEVSDYTAYMYSNEALTLTEGNSTVTIGAGDGTESTASASGDGLKVDVNGTEYTLYEDFTDALVISGFSKSEMQFEGANRKCLVQDASGKYLFFLNDAAGDTHMALYNDDNGTFSFTEQVTISDELYILLTNQGDGSDLPSRYKETTLTLNGNEFPAWQDSEEKDFFLIYALNSLGEESFYEYDNTENTYQRYAVPAKVTEVDSNTLASRITDMIDQNLVTILIVVWGIFLLLLIIIIILSTKLRHRNQELDDLYDGGYGDDGQYADEEEDDDAYYDDEEDDDAYYEDDEDDVEYYEDDDEEYEDDTEYEDDDDEYYEDDEEYEDEEDEDYIVDFVDLDN